MAIHSPNTGIVDYAEVTKSYADDFKQAGGKVFTSSKASYQTLFSKGSEIATIFSYSSRCCRRSVMIILFNPSQVDGFELIQQEGTGPNSLPHHNYDYCHTLTHSPVSQIPPGEANGLIQVNLKDKVYVYTDHYANVLLLSS